MIPELKLGFIVLTNNNYSPLDLGFPALSILIPAFEDTFWKFALPPPTPSNITKFEGVYLATALLGAVSANVSVKVVNAKKGSFLNVFYSMGSLGANALELNATWVTGNTFRVHLVADYPCLDLQAGKYPWVYGLIGFLLCCELCHCVVLYCCIMLCCVVVLL